MKEIYFLDTCAFVKYYRDEQGTDTVKQIVDTESNEIFIADWSIVEAYSALRISLFNAYPKPTEIDKVKNYFDEITTSLEADMKNKKFLLEALPREYYQKASRLIKEYGVMKEMSLKTGDAVQIVTFEKLLRNFPTAKFVSADKKLIKVIKEISYDHIDINLNRI